MRLEKVTLNRRIVLIVIAHRHDYVLKNVRH